jgi:hypothetical protein
MMNRDGAADVAIHDFSNRYVSQVIIGKNNVCLDDIEKSILVTAEVEFTKIFKRIRDCCFQREIFSHPSA